MDFDGGELITGWRWFAAPNVAQLPKLQACTAETLSPRTGRKTDLCAAASRFRFAESSDSGHEGLRFMYSDHLGLRVKTGLVFNVFTRRS